MYLHVNKIFLSELHKYSYRASIDFVVYELLSHPVLRPKLDALPLCVPGLSFTHKVTNSEINSKPVFNTMYLITKLITRPRGLNSGKGHLVTGRLPGASTPRRSLHQRTPHLLSSRAQQPKTRNIISVST
jgi:hypothetical protein